MAAEVDVRGARCLAEWFLQLVGAAAVLNDQDTRPEQVDKSGAVIQFLYVLFIAGNCAPFDPEYFKEVVIETLGFATLAYCVPQLLYKADSAYTYFILERCVFLQF